MPLTEKMINRSKVVEQTAMPVRTAVRERSQSNEVITPEISLTVSAVLAAFTILSEDLSSLPLLLYQRKGRSKFRAYDSMYYRLMHDQPNPEQSSMVFRELMVGHLLGWGNFFGQPILDKKGDVQEIWALRPDRMTVSRVDGVKVYSYQTPTGKPRIFLDDEILHIPAFGFDGLVGYSRIALARNAIGLSMSADKFGSKFFGNGTTVGLIYKHPGSLGDKAFERLNDSLKERSGTDESHKPIILEEGMSIDKLGIPPDDAQFLETRKFQVSEIARIFRVPPHMIGDVERSTSWGSGIDSQEQGYVNHTLRPWAKRIEEYLNLRILHPADQKDYFFEHLMDGLLRGDIQTRYQAYVSAIGNGFMSRNEARERENMNPRKGLDDMLQPLNMTTVADAGAATEAQQPANALAPLWEKAIERSLKREKNDVTGAAQRFLVKGQAAEFASWLNQFYRHDHAAFMAKEFKPILDAQMRIYGWDTSKQVDGFIFDCLSARLAKVQAMSAQQIAVDFEHYPTLAAVDMLEAVDGMLEDLRYENE